jgi:hypothetical protein
MSAGSDFRDRVAAEFEDPDIAQAVLIDQVVRLLDELETMEGTLATDGLTTTGGNGPLTAHPLVAASRQHRVAVGQLIAKLGIDADESRGTRAARRAANARWGNKT